MVSLQSLALKRAVAITDFNSIVGALHSMIM